MIWIIIVIIIAAFIALWLFMITPGKKKSAAKKLSSYRFAHRGLHGDGIPENSLTAFKRAAEIKCGAELDIHMTKDGYFAVMHDDDLFRMCGEKVFISDLTKSELLAYRLNGGDECIPFLEDIISVFSDIPLLIELKLDENRMDEITQKLFGILDGYKGEYFLQSFDPRILRCIRKYRKNAICGQLAGYINKSGYKIAPHIDFVVRNLLGNFLFRPDFISYRFEDKNNFNFKFIRNVFKIPVLYWTIRNSSDADTAKKEDAGIIFENIK